MGVHSFLLFLWACYPLWFFNDLLFRCISLRSPAKGLSSASAIRSIICKDGLALPLDKFKINNVDTPDIFESCSFVTLHSHQVFE